MQTIQPITSFLITKIIYFRNALENTFIKNIVIGYEARNVLNYLASNLQIDIYHINMRDAKVCIIFSISIKV